MPQHWTKIANLRCEFSTNPLGIDVLRPRLSWTMDSNRRDVCQTAYEIIVSETLHDLGNNVGKMWQSGKVDSSAEFCVEYDGKELRPATRYFWKVRAWDNEGNPTEFSSPSWWETGLLNDPNGWRKAEWVEGGRMLRREFVLAREVASARAYVCGLGYYELRINGRRAGKRVLDPAPSDWTKQIYYATYDVTSYLRAGRNAVVLVLGTGRLLSFGQRKRMAILQLKIRSTDGDEELVVTDENWQMSEESPIVSDDLYNGETYDARREVEGWDQPVFGQQWKRCKLATAPAGRLVSSAPFPPIEVVESRRPLSILQPHPSTFVVDFGQNFSGWVRLRAHGPRGTEVKVRLAELLNSDGTVNQRTNREALNIDTFILKGEVGVEEFEPHFTYHGFRYAEITGFLGIPTLDSFEGRVVHTAAESVGTLSCSNDLINKIHSAAVWSQRSNLMGIPTDSPQRDERLGWLQDALFSSEEAAMNFWMAQLFEKFLDDISDAQLEDGSIPDVVPSLGDRYPADSSCGAAYASIALLSYTLYGSRRVLAKHYDGIRRWVEFERSKSTDHILNLSKYGDWCAPGHVLPRETPPSLISTFWHLKNLRAISEIALILGKSDDARLYSECFERAAAAFNKKFLTRGNADANYARTSKEEEGLYSYGPTQTCNLLPLSLGIVPPEQLSRVIEGVVNDVSITKDGHIGTGAVGTNFFFDTLTSFGHQELAYRVATQVTYPGYGYMIREGATTLWERWEYLTGCGMNSHNHVMFGPIDAWFYKSLAGIRPDKKAPGFKHFEISPVVVGDLQSVTSSIETISGTIRSEWHRYDSRLEVKVRIPACSAATVIIPTMGWRSSILREGDVQLMNGKGDLERLCEGISGARLEKGRYVLEAKSGDYVFVVEKKEFLAPGEVESERASQ